MHVLQYLLLSVTTLTQPLLWCHRMHARQAGTRPRNETKTPKTTLLKTLSVLNPVIRRGGGGNWGKWEGEGGLRSSGNLEHLLVVEWKIGFSSTRLVDRFNQSIKERLQSSFLSEGMDRGVMV